MPPANNTAHPHPPNPGVDNDTTALIAFHSHRWVLKLLVLLLRMMMQRRQWHL